VVFVQTLCNILNKLNFINLKSKKTKKIVILSVAILGLCFNACNSGKDLSKTSDKSIVKKAKWYEKNGWQCPGGGTIVQYLKKANDIEFAKDDKGKNKDIVQYAKATSITYDNAVVDCRAAAGEYIAGNLLTFVGANIERSVADKQISVATAQGINKAILAGKQLIIKNVSKIDIYTFYKEVKDENDGKTLVQVEYACYYNKDAALQVAKEITEKELGDDVEKLHKELNEIIFKKE